MPIRLAEYFRAVLPPGHVSTSGAARLRPADRDPRRGTSSCRYRCQSRQSQCCVSETWRAPCAGRPHASITRWRGRSTAGPFHYRTLAAPLDAPDSHSVLPFGHRFGRHLMLILAHDSDHREPPMKKLLLAAVALIAFGAGHVSAADLATRPAYKAPPPAVAPATVYNWTGFYVGAGGGYGMFNVDNEGIAFTGALKSTNQTAGGKGWFGTVVGGFDYQFSNPIFGNPIVAGVFADADFSDIHGRLADTYEEGTAPLKQAWAWAVGGRIGILVVPTVLSYFNGGFTQAHFTGGAFANFDGAPTSLSLGSQTFDGWFLGSGVEMMLFPGISIKTEYRLADYETRDIPF